MNTFGWLLRREFWENKGGFFWAPIVAGGLFLLLNIMAMAVALAAAGRANIQIGLLKLDSVLTNMPPDVLAATVAGIDATVLMIAGMVSLVSAVVVFFYCLGALYDDRRDRSVLFWKSLPISDRDTVLSKLVSALFVAPAIGLVMGVITAVVMLVVVALFFAFHGQNFFGIVFIHAHPLKSALVALACLPLSALWALPTVGWLMLCSAWARTKPFLWAVGVPIASGIMVSWFDLMQSIGTPDSWYWKHVVARALLSVVPGTWLSEAQWDQMDNINSPADLVGVLTLGNFYAAAASPSLWVGAILGAAMIFMAIRLRRWRDEA